ncbi:hypothetical protein SAMN04487950_1229 [Halogranum rubrum]|uniref:Uncharacterized protein n=1 Tax=Halogranum rubrum TaxID=553466 RepID=A0A1I4CJR9_9EURY|nr:hypothetical protein [Halogranum rubrum]SFK81522.1 hypothetical protein SAMN04487950_1229 [Halogranum rubrum]
MAPTDSNRLAFGDLSRRQLLATLGVAGSVGGVVAGRSLLGEKADSEAEPLQTTVADDDTARKLAERHAPTLYFDARERWFPTDPRAFTTERDGSRVLDGFDVLDGYTVASEETEGPPSPAVCYHVVEYPDTALAVVQYWFYSAFDQFTTNFHWHDWEVLHVFVDTEAEAPVLYVASAHATSVPNNEFLDPETMRPSVISELGSHSSALGVNDRRESFQRVDLDGLVADITNGPLDFANLGELPVAYGLPRDEGFTLPFVVPELDGAPVTEHERLPNVELGDLLPPEVTVRSFTDLARPPGSLPARETGRTFAPAGVELTGEAAVDADTEYELVSLDDVRDIEALTGPQLSFEFTVPKALENAVASHLTAPDLPWEQPRFSDPSLDVTDPSHRGALRDRYGIDHPSAGDRLVGMIQQAVPAEDAPDGEGIDTERPSMEAVCLLESDPVAVPTWNGVVAVEGVPEGEHRLTVNGAGLAPYTEGVTAEQSDEPTTVGVGGAVTVVANEDAVRVHAQNDEELANVRLVDDVGGRVYDGKPPGDEGFAVYVHRGGAYTAEVTDSEGDTAAYRVNPNASDTSVGLGTIRTGKASLAAFLVDVLSEMRTAVRAEATGETTPGNAEANRNDSDVEERADATVSAENATVTGETNTTNTTKASTNTTLDDTSASVDETVTTVVGETDDSVETVTNETRSDAEDVADDATDATATANTTNITNATNTTNTTDETSDVVSETTAQVGGALGSLLDALDRAIAAAEAARDAADAGDAERANESLRALQDRLDGVERALDGGSRITGQTRGLVRRRLQVVRERTETALETPV